MFRRGPSSTKPQVQTTASPLAPPNRHVRCWPWRRCLARALLKGANILVMNECTASVDVQTDERIQSMLSAQHLSLIAVHSTQRSAWQRRHLARMPAVMAAPLCRSTALSTAPGSLRMILLPATTRPHSPSSYPWPAGLSGPPQVRRIFSGCTVLTIGVWSDTPIRDTSCCCRPLNGVPCLHPGPHSPPAGHHRRL